MIRVAAILLGAAAGVLAWGATRAAAAPRGAEPAALDYGAAGDPAAAPPVVDGRISPAGVLALAQQADPSGWLPAPELLAFVEIESAFRVAAYRYEPRLAEASYGLMQVLESTARDRGYTGPASGLFDPAVNLQVGIDQARWSWDYLARRLGAEPSEAQWVGSYNAGVGAVLRGYVPQGYVRRWQLARDRWAGGA